jgi:putative flippase GtrA
VGGTCGTLQLGILVTLRLQGAPGLAANIIAFLCSAQVNFILSNRFIWKERRTSANGMRMLVQRWWRFHLSIAGTFVLSQAIFLVGRLAVPEVIAAALGMSISAAVNFLIQDRYTFVLGQSARSSLHR